MTQIEDIYKLSPMQEGMFFHSLYDEHSQAYITQATFTLSGDFYPKAFAQAWQQVLDRHPVLRTSLIWEGVEEPYQIVQFDVTIPVSEFDWREDGEARLTAFLAEDRAEPFDLAVPPLMRVAVIRIKDNEYRAVWTFHHLLLDGWSIPIVIKELFTLYQAAVLGTNAVLPEARPYGEYSDWLAEQDLDKAQAFWCTQLSGFEVPTPLPYDKETGGEAGFARFSERLSASLTDKLVAFARKCRVTPNTLFQGAWALLLSRYSGEEDVLYGTTVSGRPAELPGVETMVGLFINTLPVRLVAPGAAVIGPWLRKIQTLLAELRQYEYSPLVKVQAWSEIPRGTSLFDSLFVYENFRADNTAWTIDERLTVSDQDVSEQTGLPLTLVVLPDKEMLIRAMYDTGRFSENQIARLVGHLCSLLEAMVTAGEGAALSSLSLLNEDERRTVVSVWNDTYTDYPAESLIHELFEEQVERHGAKTALIAGSRSWSYAELNGRANRLARELRAKGIVRDSLVPILANRSPEMVIGMLAVAKAGGAYVPIDSDYPAERINYLIADSGSALLLTASAGEFAAASFKGETLAISEWAEEAFEIAAAAEHNAAGLAAEPSDCHHRPVDEDASANLPRLEGASSHDLAYVMYTSGSTGKPKGVMIEHRNVVRLVKGTSYVQLSEDTRILQTGSVAFDASTFEVWGALLNGGQLVVVDKDTILDAVVLEEALHSYAINTLWLTSPLFTQLSQQRSRMFAGVTTLLVGGDVLSVPHINRALRDNPGLTIVNGYGPTENTTFSTTHIIDREQTGAIPIGRPIANSTAYIVDKQLRPVPAGVAGELVVGGDGVARGYWKEPEQTEEKFINDLFQDGERCYRTGDLARFCEDGTIEYKGRIDQQVKIRGFRIELGEIESSLAGHPGICEVAVIAHDETGEKRLVAYIVPERTTEGSADSGADAECRDTEWLTTEVLRGYLQSRLPDYMIPLAFVPMDSLPLTANGKVDRRALPAPVWAADEGNDYVAPTTETEIKLAEIWQQVLAVPKVGTRDNFFELGGDSILSIQIVSRANEEGVRLTPKQIFELRTIAELAKAAGERRAVSAEQGEVTGEVPLMPIQQWFFDQRFTGEHHWNQAMLLTIRKSVDLSVLELAFNRLLAHHDALRMRYERTGSGAVIQQIGPVTNDFALVHVDLSDLTEVEQKTALEQSAMEIQGSLNLTDGPLVRAVYFDRGPGRHPKLLIVIHHLVVDGVSWRIVLEDLQTVCDQLGRGEAVRLPRKTTSFRQWAEALSAYSQTDKLAEELDYWTAVSKKALTLPFDKKQGAGTLEELAAINTVANAELFTTELSAEETAALLTEVPANSKAHVQEVLLTALVRAMGRWRGQASLVLNLEGHGREELVDEVDVSRTVGWFTSMYPVALELGTDRSWAASLKMVKNQLRTIPARGIGYGLLRYLSGRPEAEQLRNAEAAQVSFNYLGRFYQAVSDSALFDLASESAGSMLGAESHRPHLLDFNVMVIDDRLVMYVTYCRELFEEATISALTGWFRDELRGLIEYGKSPEQPCLIPSDLPLAELEQHQLDVLLNGALAGRKLEDLYTLTPLQEGMLFESLLNTDSQVYVQQAMYTFRGALQWELFEEAWQRVADRHPILRTVFLWENVTSPHQAVISGLRIPFEWLNWSDVMDAELDVRLETFLAKDAAKGFDLATGPLMRLAVIRFAPDSYKMAWTFHHLLLDGWSLQRVLGEVLETYEALCQGRTLQLSLSRPYRAFIDYVKRRPAGESEAYWRGLMQGLTEPTPLPLERPTEEASGIGSHTAVLSAEMAEQLQFLARKRQLTLGTFIQGAWAYLLSRYTGSSDVVFGITVAGRPTDLDGSDAMVGLFINTLPIRVQVDAELPIGDWLERLQSALLDMRQYEHCSLADIQGWTDIPRGEAFIESLVVFENYPMDSVARQGVGSLLIESARAYERPNLPLTMAAALGRELELHALYDRSRFTLEAIERLFGHFKRVLEGLAAGIEAPVGSLELLTEQERSKILLEWNKTQAPYPGDKLIHELFEEQVARVPKQMAVTGQGLGLTYAELNDQANVVARKLRERGIQRDQLVPVLATRVPQMIVALLGILKAGGAYVPIDSEYPAERIEWMLQDCGSAVLLTVAGAELPGVSFEGEIWQLESLLEAEHKGQTQAEHAFVESSEASESSMQGGALRNLQPLEKASPHDLAYVMYTSGSTGKPKGVMVEHRGVVRLVQNTNYVTFSEDTRILQTGPFVFDASTFEIWGALLNGGQVHVTDKETILDPEAIKRVFDDNQINTVFITTALFNQLSQQDSRVFGGLNTVLFGGELISLSHVNRVVRDNPDLNVVHVYGPTENTTFSTFYPVKREYGEAPPIGYPIAHSTAYIVDEKLRLLPPGVVGELVVGGVGVARGYRNQPELTVEQFIASPFREGERLYRTGDLASYRSDGAIEYRGRADEQVKIRGFRIEPGEIETALVSHPGIREAKVVMLEPAPGDKRLAAYLVPETETNTRVEWTGQELRGYLGLQLPSYMIPSAYVTLKELPLTPNGKVNKKELPEPEWSVDPLAEDGGTVREHAVLTPQQELMATIWAQVLGTRRLGLYDHFFELGGHSILATQLISRVREVFRIDLPLRVLFDYPLLGDFMAQVERERRKKVSEFAPIVPVSGRGEEVPLSFAQQRLWFLDQLEPDSQFYNIYAALRLTGELNVPALERSLNELVCRHESLRTVFASDGGKASQRILPSLSLMVRVEDLTHLSGEVQEAEALRLAVEEAGTRFDLTKAPLLRVAVLHLGDREHVMCVTMHHIISDGWSISVLVRELGALYESSSTEPEEEALELPELAIQYADYAIWQREWIEGKVREEQLAYWKERLHDVPPVLELPLDYPRPAVQSYQGASLNRLMLEGLVKRLEKLSREEGTTLYMTLLTGFEILLHRYSGQDVLCVGTPVANRNRPEIEGLIGFFVNMLPIRSEFTGNRTVRELLRQSRDTTLSAYDHQDLPLEELVDAIQPERSLSHTPLFQVIFDMQTKQMGTIELPGLTAHPLPVELGEAKFDLGLTFGEMPEGLVASLNYSTSLFEAATIERMMGHLRLIYEQMAENPDEHVGSLHLLTEDERSQLAAWNTTEIEYSQQTVHERIERQAALRPEATALVAGEIELTYDDLNRRANQLAHYLIGQGVGADTLVGIYAERSAELAVAILGVLKAGGAYVPLDPAYPQERIAFMIEDARLSFLLTQEHLMDALPSHLAPTIRLDADWGTMERQPDTAPESRVTLEQAAYVIYTSGSTGTPKGVVVTHGSLLNHNLAVSELYGLSLEDRVLQFAAISFDVAVEELLPSWINGACVVMALDRLMGPAEFTNFADDHQLTVLNLPAAYWHQWVQGWTDAAPEEGGILPESVRAVIVGSERPSPQHLGDWKRLTGDRAVWFNAYGPTEATVTSTVFRAPAGESADYGEIPIGRPIANTKVYVLDRYRQQVPVGVVGELFIGGQGLARGYLGRPELTAEKFITSPFNPGERLYETGDLVRFNKDGQLEYLGRTDYQVKIRGFRIELGEVEQALARQPQVKAAVVEALEVRPGDKRLVGYAVPQESAAETVSAIELRQALKVSLPGYMVPAAIVILPELPITPGGKVDRKALPQPDWSLSEDGGDYTPPQTPLEDRLVSIWGQVLGVSRIGIHDNFFELGGDSILSIQVVAKAGQAGIKLTPKQMFQHQSVAELARVAVTAASAPQAEQGLLTGEAPLTPIQRWFFEQPLEQRHHWNQAVMLSVQAPVNRNALEAAVDALLRHHDALRFRYTHTEEGWQQRYAPLNSSEEEGEDLATDLLACSEADAQEKAKKTKESILEWIDLSALSSEQQKAAMLDEAERVQCSLSLENGPLFKAVLYHLGTEGASKLLLVAHHLAVDGVSWRILLEDLQQGYMQLQSGQPSKLPPKTASYSFWAESLQAYAQSEDIRGELDYWLAQTDAADILPDAPDAPAGKDECFAINTVRTTRTVSLSLEAEETKALLQDVPAVLKTQVNDVLLAALALAMRERTGSNSLLLQLEGHGREELPQGTDVLRTVGWFTAVYPVKLNLEGADVTLEAVKRVKEQLRCIPRRGLGYGLLRYLSKNQDIKQQMEALQEPQIIFNYLGQFDQVMKDGPFQGAEESVGTMQSPESIRSNAIEINAAVAEGQLQLTVMYSEKLHREETIRQLAEGLAESLRRIIGLRPEAGANVLTPSDFPLARLTQQQLDRVLADTPDIEDLYLLSPLQKGMLFHTLYTPESSVYFEQTVFTLTGALQEDALRKAWQRMTERHTVLRTKLILEGMDEPHQAVLSSVQLPFEVLDWCGLSAEGRQEKLTCFLEAERQRGFDLSQAPLMQVTLIREGEGCHTLVWSHHHLLIDGWSVPILLYEMLQTYETLSRGGQLALLEARPYRAFIDWLQSREMELAESFWREALNDYTEPAVLPVKRAQPLKSADKASDTSKPTLEGWHASKLPEALSAVLQQAARRHQVTLNTMVQAAWAILLSRYSGADDIVYGTTFSGRPTDLPGADAIVGLFINTLPVRVKVDEGQMVGEFLRELQARQADLQQFEYTPLSDIQSWSGLPKGISLFDSLVVFENYPVYEELSDTSGKELLLDIMPSPQETNYPLTVIAAPGKEITLSLSYDPAWFDAGSIGRIARHLRRILEGLAAELPQTVGSLMLLEEEELRLLLEEWNATDAQFAEKPCTATGTAAESDDEKDSAEPTSGAEGSANSNEQAVVTLDSKTCIHRLVEQQAALMPEGTALVAAGERLSYLELNARANQVARYLRKQNVGPEVPVGVCMERGAEMLVALLGVLKAGGAYVPIDPAYPKERIAFILEDTQVPVLLTQAHLLERLPTPKAGVTEVIALDAQRVRFAAESEDNINEGAGVGNLAYIIYTSGSTGQPKGVEITHGSLLNLVHWHRSAYRVTGEDRATLLAGTAFDASVWEIWPYLASGAELHAPDEETRLTPDKLRDWLLASGITLSFLPTPLAERIVTLDWPEQTPLRAMLTGGDKLHRHPTVKLPFALMNHYGPTENTVVATYGEVPVLAAEADDRLSPTIGRPIANTRCYILDQHGRPVPVGVPGELYLGGASLARGYFKRPELTSKQFVLHPFSANEGERLYRTGDLCRYREDGEIEYIGRIDNQVKIRGFRIELGEIETALSLHSDVREAVVLALEPVTGHKRLVAYVVPHVFEEAPDADSLRGHLKDRLPDYMVPSVIVTLAELPLTPNGKVDRRTLPEPDWQAAGDEYEAPCTEMEKLLCRIWSKVLGQERVGIRDNYFELGGDSMLSMQIIFRVSEAGWKLTPKQLFEHQTIAELAPLAEKAEPEAEESSDEDTDDFGWDASDLSDILGAIDKHKG
ncbi:Linear gramicidin synthase subunit B [compost metagenome]